VSRLFFIPTFAVFLVLQQAQGRAAEDAEVGVGTPLSWSGNWGGGGGGVLTERPIELPVESVLDAPVGVGPRAAAPNDRALILLLRM